jgi:predicted dehydrogenase
MTNSIYRLGILGLSEGNGHPYSWAAICNGYNKSKMEECPFSAIPEYLAKQVWPQAQIPNAIVTHIWTQDLTVSKHVAASAKITTVVQHPEEMMNSVDAVLLARDDAENHPEMVAPFLKAGLPVFVDKPFALSQDDASSMLKQQQYETQIFTCSSLRYAQELQLTREDISTIGDIRWVEASVMKKWDTYAVHVLEPIIAQLGHRGELKHVQTTKIDDLQLAQVKWENLMAFVKVTGKYTVPLAITFFGSKGSITKTFADSFSCFKASIQKFIEQVETKKQLIPRHETLEIVDIIEWGRK